jgi:hypothetical protein
MVNYVLTIIIFTISRILANNLNDNDDIGNLPSIFIVVAQKGGSSSLYDLMANHPLLYKGHSKESQYFHSSNYKEKGTTFYKRQFSKSTCDTKNGTKYIDGTPILHQDRGHVPAGESVWDKIYATYSENVSLRNSLKFIVLLREPVSRDFSWYQHSIRNH